jgi:hypothetical protein
MCVGQTSPSGNGGGSPEKRWGNGGTVESHYARNSVKADPHYIPKGNDFSSKYEAGKPLPAGDKNSSSYWQNLVSTDGGKTLHTLDASKLALESGYKNPAYQLHHSYERQKAGISDFDIEGFKPSFYKGMPAYKGKDGKTYSIPSDKETLESIPKAGGKFLNALMPGAFFVNADRAAKNTDTKTKTKTKKKVTGNQSTVKSINAFALNATNNKYKTILGA